MIFTSRAELAMFKTVKMPNRIPGGDGKYIKDPSGAMVEMTGYYFVDEVGSQIYCVTKNDAYRAHKGSFCDIQLEVEYNEMDRKNKVTLKSVTPVAKAK